MLRQIFDVSKIKIGLHADGLRFRDADLLAIYDLIKPSSYWRPSCPGPQVVDFVTESFEIC
jgi:hypothetical protein